MEISHNEVEFFLLENSLLFIEGISILASILLLIVYWKRSEKSPFLIFHTLFQIFVVIYVAAHMMKHYNEALKLQSVYFSYIKSIFFLFSQITCLLLCWIFINPQKKLDGKILPAYILPSLYALLMSTNNWHRLFGKLSYDNSGGFLDLTFKKSLLCYIIEGLIFLSIVPFILKIITHLSRQRGFALKQGILLLSTGAVPLLVYGYDLSFGIKLPIDFDLVPVTTAVSTFLFAVAAFRYRLLNLIPIAFREFVEHLKTSILVLDKDDRIIYSNAVFKQTFSMLREIKRYENVTTTLENLKDFAENIPEIEAIGSLLTSPGFSEYCWELNLGQPEKKCFQVSLQPIIAYGNETVGKILSFNEITAYRNLLDEVNEKNTQLAASYEKLCEHAATVEKLAIATERNRLAMDAHDTLGYTLTSLICLLDMSLMDFDNNPAKAREELDAAARAAREGRKELRNSIYSLTHTGFDSRKSLNLLESLVSNFSSMGVNVDFTVEGNTDIDNNKLWTTIYQICREALTNAVRHGKAQNIAIILKFVSNCVKLYIFDDGQGCGEIKKGLGLSGMEQRVTAMGGTIVYGSGEDGGGFNINVQMPF